MRLLRCLWVVVALVGSTSTVVGAGWEPPVQAPIVDGFRAPASTYGSGNRGIEYGLTAGTTIRAVDAGRVVFAGSVGGARHVVVDHGDGLRSTSAYLESIAVVRGQHVRQGQALGAAGPGFHLTARLGEDYVDPTLLFDGATVGVRLVVPNRLARSVL